MVQGPVDLDLDIFQEPEELSKLEKRKLSRHGTLTPFDRPPTAAQEATSQFVEDTVSPFIGKSYDFLKKLELTDDEYSPLTQTIARLATPILDYSQDAGQYLDETILKNMQNADPENNPYDLLYGVVGPLALISRGAFGYGEMIAEPFAQMAAKVQVGEPITGLDVAGGLLSAAELLPLKFGFVKNAGPVKTKQAVDNIITQNPDVPIKDINVAVTNNPSFLQNAINNPEADLNIRYVKGPKQKKSVAPTLKGFGEVVPGIKIKDFDQSLLKTKPLTDPLVKKTITKPVLQKARKEISQNLKKYFAKKKDFTTKDLKDNVVTSIFEKSFNKIGLKRANLEGNIREDYVRLNKTINPETNKPYIDDQLLQEIIAYQNKRRVLSGAIADRISAKSEAVTTKAKEALDFLNKKQKGINKPLEMNKIVLYDRLAQEFPKKYNVNVSVSRKREIIDELVAEQPKIGNALGLKRKIDEDTLAPEPPSAIEQRRQEVEVEMRKNYPNELIEGIPDEKRGKLPEPPLVEGAPYKKVKKRPDFFLSEGRDIPSLRQNPIFKFYEFLSRTLPETSMKQLFKNVKIGDPTDLANPAQKLFNSFKQLEDVRKEVSPKIRPLLERIFGKQEKGAPTVQIAHTFQSGKLAPYRRKQKMPGKKEEFTVDIDPEEFIGQGVNPDFLYLDISPYNQGIQNFLEASATKAIREGNFAEFDKIDQLMTNIGIKGTVDNLPVGKPKKLYIKLQAILDELKKRGDPIPEEKDILEAIEILRSSGPEGYSYGGLVEEDLDIFQDDLPENSFEVASLKLPFFKLFGKAPVNEVAPIPTPKESLTNPTKKQTQSLETEKAKRAEEDIFDPTPGEAVMPEREVAMTPLTNQPMTSVFYSDIERALTNAPDEFPNKQAVLDFMNKNRIKKSEVEDYRIPSLLKLYDDDAPITKQQILSQVRTAPISGLRVHGTGKGSDIINPNGDVDTRYTGYAEPGFIPDTQRERVLYINRNKLPGDTGEYPQSMFGGENIQRHNFGIPNEDNTYIVGWTRLTDRFGFVPPKVAGPETKINVRQLNRQITKNNRSISGLYAEAQSKLIRLAEQRGLNRADIDELEDDLSIGATRDLSRTENAGAKITALAKYKDQLDEISPGLVDQIDDLIVKNRELYDQVTKASAVDPSGVVRVTFADEIQSDLLQAAAMRKQQLTAAIRKIQEEGLGETNLQGLNRLAEQTINFYEKNKSVFRPLKKTEAEVKTIADRVAKLDEEVDAIVNKYIQTREVSDADLTKLSGLLNENLDNMLKEIIEIDSAAMDGLFPDLPFKNRDEWADALIKKDLYELAYRKFVLKDPDASSYYAVSPSKYVSKRYNFEGNAATPKDVRDMDKASRIETFKREGRFVESKYKGIGMDEFYGGPNSVSNVIDESGTKATNPNYGKPKHYTSTIETILKKQAKSNNSELITMPVQLKSGKGTTQYIVEDQNGNMVATLTNPNQATELTRANPNYKITAKSAPNKASMEPVFAIKITPEMLEPYKTHKAQGGLVEHIDIFEV